MIFRSPRPARPLAAFTLQYELRSPTQQLHVDGLQIGIFLVNGDFMRSDQIHRALKQGMNRFEMCQLVSKGVRATHKTGGRFEDTINDALQFLGTHKSDQKKMHAAPIDPDAKSLKSAA